MKELFLDHGSDVYSRGRHWEDGHEMEGLAYYLRIADKQGYQWTMSIGTVPEQFGHTEMQDRVQEALEEWSNAIRGGFHPSTDDRWNSDEPMYGSQAYEESGTEQERAWQEKKDAEEEGWR